MVFLRLNNTGIVNIFAITIAISYFRVTKIALFPQTDKYQCHFLHFLFVLSRKMINFAHNSRQQHATFHYIAHRNITQNHYKIQRKSMKHKYIAIIFTTALASLTACQESMEDKAERDAKEYNRKYCPTPVINYTRTDSVSFDKKTHVYTYYCSFCNEMDNKEIIDANKQAIKDTMTKSVKESTTMKPYLEAGFHFRYICRSDKSPKTILLRIDL